MDIPSQIKAKRDAAAQAWRLVKALSTDDDRKRIQIFAEELEAQACPYSKLRKAGKA
jgi:hypothetical protein